MKKLVLSVMFVFSLSATSYGYELFRLGPLQNGVHSSIVDYRFIALRIKRSNLEDLPIHTDFGELMDLQFDILDEEDRTYALDDTRKIQLQPLDALVLAVRENKGNKLKAHLIILDQEPSSPLGAHFSMSTGNSWSTLETTVKTCVENPVPVAYARPCIHVKRNQGISFRFSM